MKLLVTLTKHKVQPIETAVETAMQNLQDYNVSLAVVTQDDERGFVVEDDGVRVRCEADIANFLRQKGLSQ